jgi:hypothetical protein
MRSVRHALPLIALYLLLVGSPAQAAARPGKTEVVPKWDRFERVFASSIQYTNPFHEVAFQVGFTSPSGDAVEVPGFWDGANRWRVRFTPGELGRWSFQTYCSDPENTGLHQQRGEFLCSASVGRNPLSRHGPVRVSANGQRLEHRDGTPFFLAADTSMEGAIKSALRDWQIYGNTRALQGFNAVVWAATPGRDTSGDVGVGGFSDRLQLNPDYFRRLDDRFEALRQAGLVNVVVPFSDALAVRGGGARLTQDQLALLLRYLIARWDSGPVIWLLPAEDADPDAESAGWKQLGKAVFAQTRQAPVMVQARMHSPVLDSFREEDWVQAFACGVLTRDPAELAKELLALGFADGAATSGKLRPAIPFLPEENSPIGSDAQSESADLVRRAAAWTLLSTRPNGFCSAARGVSAWKTASTGQGELRGFPAWRTALYMPGSRQLGALATELAKLPYWKLQPARELLNQESAKTSPLKFVPVAAAEDGSLLVAFTPQGDTIQFKPGALPSTGTVTWFNIRTGKSTTGSGTIATELKPPEPGDWLLIVRKNP